MISLVLNVFTRDIIFVASACAWLVGIVWYSPFMFGSRWVALSSVRIERSRYTFVCMILNFITLFMQAYICAWSLEIFEAWTLTDAFIVVGSIAFACSIMPLIVITAWERRSWEVCAIHSGATMVAFFVMTSILVHMAL